MQTPAGSLGDREPLAPGGLANAGLFPLAPPSIAPDSLALSSRVREVLREPGQPLDSSARAFAEPLFGHDFAQVRVHADHDAQQSALEQGAAAYAVGTHIVFGPGQFAPLTRSGRALLTHELAHVVQQSEANHVLLQRQPAGTRAPAPDGQLELERIVGENSLPKLKIWLQGNPTRVAAAAKYLFEKAKGAPKYNELLQMALALTNESDPTRVRLRSEAKAAAKNYWEKHVMAAHVNALRDWAVAARAGTAPSGWIGSVTKRSGLPKNPVLNETLDRATKALEQLVATRDPALQNMTQSLRLLPLSGMKFAAEEQLIRRLTLDVDKEIAEAVQRRRVYTTAHPRPKAQQELRALAQLRSTVANDEARRDEAKQALGTPSPNAGEARRRLEAAERKLKLSTASEQSALGKLSPGARRSLAYRESAQVREEVDTALLLLDWKWLNIPRNRAPIGFSSPPWWMPSGDSQPGHSLSPNLQLSPDALKVTSEEAVSKWIDQKFWDYIQGGTSEYPLGLMLQQLQAARNRTITLTTSTGIEAGTRPTTYSYHTWGMYDLGARRGTRVRVAQPATLDMSNLLGASHDAFNEAFDKYEWQGSRVTSAFGNDGAEGEREVIDKLQFGLFNRNRPREILEKWDIQQGFPLAELKKQRDYKAQPDHVMAALLQRNAVKDAPLDASLEDELEQLRGTLESLLETSPKLQPLHLNRSQEMLKKAVDASQGNRWLNASAFVAPGDAVNEVPPPATQAFGKEIRRLLGEDNQVTRGLLSLLQDRYRKLRARHLPGTTGMSGLTVVVVHHYRTRWSGKQLWIRVEYLHLEKILAKPSTQETRAQLIVGNVGATGNAFDAHVHMTIAAYLSPSLQEDDLVAHLNPVDFFGMVAEP